MTRIRVVLFLLLSLIVTASVRAETYGAVLTPQQENPPTVSNGFGNATVTLDPSHTSINVRLSVSGLTSPINNAHIHGEAPSGTNTGVVINFLPAINIVNGQMNTTFSIEKSLGDKIAANPHLYYINVHTTQNPGGEVRGQLTQIDNVTKFSADLRSSNEVPPNSSTLIGSALITIDNANNLTFEINTPGIVSPTAAHIHGPDAPAGVNRSVFVGFVSPGPGAFSGGRLRGTIAATADQMAQIKANPSNFYVNVHTSANPGGEVRGQLVAVNEYDIPVSGKVAGAADTNFVTDLRIFNPSYTARATALIEYFQAGITANTNATASTAIDIPPRGTAVMDDVNGAAFLNSIGTTGALRVTSASQLAVTSRIYNDLRGSGRGTFGQFVPASTPATALRRGVLPQLSNKALTTPLSGFRTNVGVFNPNTGFVTVRLELRDAAGVLLGQQALTLAGLTQFQTSIATLFPTLDLSDRANLTLSFDASAPILGYASIVDNVSSDQVFISAQPDPGVSAP